LIIDVYLTYIQHCLPQLTEKRQACIERKSDIVQEEKPVAYSNVHYEQRHGTSGVKSMRRRILRHRPIVIAFAIIVVIVVAIIPTPHTTVSENLSDNWSLNIELTPGGNTSFHKVENLGSGTISSFVVNVQSNTTVNITIIGVQGKTVLSGSWNYVYRFTGVQQAVNFTCYYSSYLFGIFQPNGTDRSNAHVQGSIDTYSMNRTSQLLPWWMP
jgi:hypothetical protein